MPWIFHLWLESPELCARVQELGAFCRYGTGLPPRLSELTILIVAKHWGADYEWSVHEGEARKAGVPDPVIAAIAAGETPPFEDEDAALLYELCTIYLSTNDVPDALFTRASEHFGRRSAHRDHRHPRLLLDARHGDPHLPPAAGALNAKLHLPIASGTGSSLACAGGLSHLAILTLMVRRSRRRREPRTTIDDARPCRLKTIAVPPPSSFEARCARASG